MDNQWDIDGYSGTCHHANMYLGLNMFFLLPLYGTCHEENDEKPVDGIG
jgi:riboflavin transporter FmnP